MLESQRVPFDLFPAGVLYRECVIGPAVPELSTDKMDWATSGGRLIDGEHGHHSTLDVIVDVAVKHPCAGVVRQHVNFFRGPWHKLDHIHVLVTVADRFPVPMRTVNIDLISHAHHVPAHLVALLHGEAGQISKYVPVDGIEQSLRFPAQLIKNHE